MSAGHDKLRITDAALVLLVKTGRRKGAETLYDTYAKLLFLTICRIVPERKIAEQVLQATFQKIWSSINDYQIEKERIYTWMVTIARKTALTALAETTRNYEQKKEAVYAGKG